MLINTPTTPVKDFIDQLNQSLAEIKPNAQLTAIQSKWLGFCLMGILMLNGINWAKFERAGLGQYKMAALSWMFHHAKIAWDYLLIASVRCILVRYGITGGSLVLDEVDRERSKRTTCIYKAHKQKHKPSGGYVNGQCIVLLLLVSDKISCPVGFCFYQPDPDVSAWEKEEKRLKKKKTPKKERPKKPAKHSDYPSKLDIALQLLRSFQEQHSDIKVHAVLADALYGTGSFMDQASSTFGGTQVISQLRSNQIINTRGKAVNLSHYFTRYNQGTVQKITVRGHKTQEGTISSARLYVKAHQKKRFVIALKYEGEDNYRYLVATDMTWRTRDILQAYTLRWLVEVFFEDWKLYEGWGREAKQQGEEGSSRSLILSLLFDHCLLLHPEQKACIESKQPMATVGSLQRKLQMTSLLETMTQLLFTSNDVSKQLKILADKIQENFQLMPSGKHMIGRDLGRLAPTSSLLYRAHG
jgi:hypothetical protein